MSIYGDPKNALIRKSLKKEGYVIYKRRYRQIWSFSRKQVAPGATWSTPDSIIGRAQTILISNKDASISLTSEDFLKIFSILKTIVPDFIEISFGLAKEFKNSFVVTFKWKYLFSNSQLLARKLENKK